MGSTLVFRHTPHADNPLVRGWDKGENALWIEARYQAARAARKRAA